MMGFTLTYITIIARCFSPPTLALPTLPLFLLTVLLSASSHKNSNTLFLPQLPPSRSESSSGDIKKAQEIKGTWCQASF